MPGSREPHHVPDIEPAAPRNGQLVCKTLQLGVCGTDRDIISSGTPFLPPDENHLILGHECLAIVEQTTEAVVNLKKGDLVVPVVRRPLNNDSDSGNDSVGGSSIAKTASESRVDMMPFGTYTERGIVHEHGFSLNRWLDEEQFLIPVEESMRDIVVLAEPMAVAEKAVNEAIAVQCGRLGEAWGKQGPRVLVTGMGPIGFTALLASLARGWHTTMWGRDPKDSFRASLAQQFGAEYENSVADQIMPADVQQDGFDLILECTGNDDVTLQAARSLASCGVMVWLGADRRPMSKEHNVSQLMRDAIMRNHIHLGSVNAAMRDFRDAIAHLKYFQQTKPQELDSLITRRVTPQDAISEYRSRTAQSIKAVLMYD
jgi:threonine dehydrogenase-like Zn-dependent dehydrogenase